MLAPTDGTEVKVMSAVSRAPGLLIGITCSGPFALLAFLYLRRSSEDFAVAVAVACLVSGGIAGATFGRQAAARGDRRSLLIGPLAAVLIGSPVAAAIMAVRAASDGDVLMLAVVGLAYFGLPAYLLLALPAFFIGVALARRLAQPDIAAGAAYIQRRRDPP